MLKNVEQIFVGLLILISYSSINYVSQSVIGYNNSSYMDYSVNHSTRHLSVLPPTNVNRLNTTAVNSDLFSTKLLLLYIYTTVTLLMSTVLVENAHSVQYSQPYFYYSAGLN